MAKKAKAKAKKKTTALSVRSPIQGVAPLISRLRREAQAVVTKNRLEVQKNLERLQKQIQTTAERTIRDLEERLLKRINAATDSEVKRLEQRVARLEELIGEGEGAADQA